MQYNRSLAELLGAFALTFVVWLATVFPMPVPAAVMAALTLGLFVYLVGGVSGAHLNPAVTIGILSIKKISPKDAAMYILAQLAGASLALLVGMALSQGKMAYMPHDADMVAGLAEAIGAFFLCFAVTAVTLGKVEKSAAGVVVGGSLFIGIFMASVFSNAILNPAVALGVGSFGSMYILGPVVGAVAGAWAAKWMLGAKKAAK